MKSRHTRGRLLSSLLRHFAKQSDAVLLARAYATTLLITVIDCVLDGAAYRNVVLTNPASGSAFAFSPLRGTVTPAGNAQVQSDNGQQVRVVVSMPGHIRLCSPSGSGNMGGYALCP